VRVDIFGLKEGGTIDGPIAGAVAAGVPALERGQTYLLEVVLRTVRLGTPLHAGDGGLQRGVGGCPGPRRRS
jgi:hypothetical protein